MIVGKRHIGLAGYPPRITDEDVPLPLEDHQDERPPEPAATQQGVFRRNFKTDPPTPGEVISIDTKGRDLATALREDYGIGSTPSYSFTDAALEEHFSAIETALIDLQETTRRDPDAQFARGLLDFNERLTRIEKQIAFMSSAQAMQEKQMSLHKRATALDLAIKACGSDVTAGDLTGTADAFVIWLEAGVSG